MKITREQRDAWEQNTAGDAFNFAEPSDPEDRRRARHRGHVPARKRYGVTVRYDHLNPGQQRMNIGNMLRKVVPTSHDITPGSAAGADSASTL